MINLSAFLHSLPIVLYGMCGIFIVIAIIFFAIKIIAHFGDKENIDD